MTEALFSYKFFLLDFNHRFHNVSMLKQFEIFVFFKQVKCSLLSYKTKKMDFTWVIFYLNANA